MFVRMVNGKDDCTVTVTGADDCGRDGKQVYSVILGKAVSLDPNYFGIQGAPVEVTNKDSDDSKKSTTGNDNLFICGMTVVSERKTDANTWEYVLRGELTNTGVAVAGVTATLTKWPDMSLTAVDPVLVFGAVGKGDIGKTSDTVTLRSTKAISSKTLRADKKFQWTVVVKP